MKLRQVVIPLMLVMVFCLGWSQTALSDSSQDEKQTFLKETADKLNVLDKEITELKEKGIEAKDDVKAEYKEQMNVLQQKRQEAMKKLEHLKKTGKQGWVKAKSDMSAAVSDLESFYNNMIDHFKIRK